RLNNRYKIYNPRVSSPSIRYLIAIDTPFPRHISATSSPQIRYPTSTYMHRNMHTPPQRHKYASQLHPYTPFCPYMSAHMQRNMHRNYIRICTATCTAIHPYTRNPSANKYAYQSAYQTSI